VRAFSFILVCLCLWCLPVSAQQTIEMMGALIKEQDVTFAVVIVKKPILDDKRSADTLIRTLEPAFGNIPVVLMAQDAGGKPSYYGRPDIARFLSTVPVGNITWKKYTLSR
jgi:hypothetical protein